MFSLLYGLWEYLFRKEELHVLILGEMLLCEGDACTAEGNTACCRSYMPHASGHLTAPRHVQASTRLARLRCWSD